MKHLPRSIIALLIGLTIFYNIERVDIGKENLVDMRSFVYIVGILAVISIIMIPVLRRHPVHISLGLWIGIYVLGQLLFFNEHSLVGGVYTYLFITEVVLLSILIWLAHHLAHHLLDFEKAVKNITFTDSSGKIRKLDEATEDIQTEMFRSRHSNSPLSIILVQPEPGSIQTALHRAVQEVQQAMLNSYVINSMAQTLTKYLRRTDMILEQRDQDRFIIFCPDTNAADSALLVEYVKSVATEQLGVSVACGVATFPDEALTFEEMVHQAEFHLDHLNSSSPLGSEPTSAVPT